MEGKPIYRVDHAALLHKVASDYSCSRNNDDKAEEKSLKWYRRAAALGDQDAAEQVREFEFEFDARTQDPTPRARTHTHSLKSHTH